MKYILFAAVVFVGSLLIATKSTDNDEPKKISYIQCVVVDGKIHDCTDITDFKILKTESIDGHKEHN